MNRINIKYQLLNFILLFVLQLFVVHKISLFNVAFGFFYIGFILFLPSTTRVGYMLILSFLIGLIVDLFYNTPGLHAGATVLIAFLRNIFLSYFLEGSQEQTTVSIKSLGFSQFFILIFPLIFVHHLFLFIVENEGFYLFGRLFIKIITSSALSFSIILAVNLIVAPSYKRL